MLPTSSNFEEEQAIITAAVTAAVVVGFVVGFVPVLVTVLPCVLPCAAVRLLCGVEGAKDVPAELTFVGAVIFVPGGDGCDGVVDVVGVFGSKGGGLDLVAVVCCGTAAFLGSGDGDGDSLRTGGLGLPVARCLAAVLVRGVAGLRLGDMEDDGRVLEMGLATMSGCGVYGRCTEAAGGIGGRSRSRTRGTRLKRPTGYPPHFLVQCCLREGDGKNSFANGNLRGNNLPSSQQDPRALGIILSWIDDFSGMSDAL